MKMTHDKEADAVYIYFTDKPYAYGKSLDSERHIDYSTDGEPMGLELLNVSAGVNLDDVPHREEVEQLLTKKHIKVFA